MRALQAAFYLLMLSCVLRAQERTKTETVAESFDRRFAVIYEQSVGRDTPETATEEERLRGRGTAGAKDSVGTVYIADAATGKRLLTIADFEGGRISASWRPGADDYVIVGWSTERFNWGRKLLQRITDQKAGQTTFREVNLEKLGLTKTIRRDPKRMEDSEFIVTPDEWDRTNLIAGLIAIERSGRGAHPFAQDEIWYDARIAIRPNGLFEVVALWRTHGSDLGVELVWEK